MCGGDETIWPAVGRMDISGRVGSTEGLLAAHENLVQQKNPLVS